MKTGFETNKKLRTKRQLTCNYYYKHAIAQNHYH